MQMMFSGFGSGGRSLTFDSGLPLPLLAAAANLGLKALHFSITPRMTSCGPSTLMPFTKARNVDDRVANHHAELIVVEKREFHVCSCNRSLS